MPIRQDLMQAYCGSEYRMDIPGHSCVLKVGQRSPELDAMSIALACDCAAFISASNPGSRSLPAAINRSRHHMLEQILRARRLRYFPGVGYSTAHMAPWPTEPGFLILNLSSATAIALAASFGQNALLYYEHNQPIFLVFTEVAKSSR